MKSRLGLFIVLLLAAATGVSEITNRVVARVNDRILTLYDFESRYEQAVGTMRDQIPTDAAERDEFLGEVARRIMRSLWDEMLILSRADQKGWTITDTRVREVVDQMKAQNGIERDEDLIAALAAEGLDFETWKDSLGTQLLYRQVVGREVYNLIEIPDEDLRRYYRSHEEEFEVPAQMEVREIVILEGDGAAVLEERAASVLEKLRSGATFEEVGSELESGQISNVLELGWVAVGDLDPKLAIPLGELEVGEFTDPIAARGGLHVVQLVDLREAQIAPFDEIELELRQRMEAEAVDERLVEFLIELENEAFLTLDPPAIAAGFRTSTGETPIEVTFPLFEDIEQQGLPESGKTELE